MKEPSCAYSANNHRWLALSFREQLTRFYHNESSSSRPAIVPIEGAVLFELGVNLQKIECAVIWNYFRLLMLNVVPDISRLKMIEIEIVLTFVFFLECTVVQCKDALSIYWNRHSHEFSRIWKLSANFTPIQCIKIVSRFCGPRYIGKTFF
jgi:hypothetical protein